MNTLLAVIDRYDWIIYIVCVAGALIYLNWALAARREQRQSIFSLEREEKASEMQRAFLLFLVFVAILGTTAYVNFWVLGGSAGGPSIGPTLSLGPTLTPSPVIGQAFPTSTPTAEPTATPEPMVPPTAPPAPTAAPVPPTATPPPPSPTFAVPPTAPPANCPNSGVRITSPGNGQQVSGTVNVVGTASIENFQFYKVEYNDGNGFAVIGDVVRQPVTGGLLATWNAVGFPGGTYTLRLTVVDVTGNYPPPCDVTVVIP